jgi:spore coat protein U-like protein
MTRLIAYLFTLVLSLAAGCLILPGTAHAVTETCSFTSAAISFSTASTVTGTIGYICSTPDILGDNFTLCATPGTPSSGTVSQPTMVSGAYSLNYNLYTNTARTQVWSTTNAISTAVSLPASLNGSTVTGTIPFYGTIPGGQSPASGNYTGALSGTILGIVEAGTCNQNYNNVLVAVFTGASTSLAVSAQIPSNCTVTAGTTLSLGTVVATASAVSGSTTILVNCTLATPYYLGLSPSNGSTTGAGILTGTGSNTDQPAYQLRSVSTSGPVWGNTATSTAVGNGVAGTGNAVTQAITVYASLPSANYTPDTYTDTVTVNVNY